MPGALVRRVRLDLRADEELAAVRLRDVHVELRGDEDDVEERLHRLGDEGLEDVRRDREPQPDEPADERRPAGGRAHDLTALDAAAGRLDRGDRGRRSRSKPVTSVFWWISTPRRSAARAKPHTTASWRMIPPGGW